MSHRSGRTLSRVPSKKPQQEQRPIDNDRSHTGCIISPTLLLLRLHPPSTYCAFPDRVVEFGHICHACVFSRASKGRGSRRSMPSQRGRYTAYHSTAQQNTHSAPCSQSRHTTKTLQRKQAYPFSINRAMMTLQTFLVHYIIAPPRHKGAYPFNQSCHDATTKPTAPPIAPPRQKKKTT